MKNLYWFLTLCFFTQFTFYGQGENNNWYFGERLGLNFNTVPPSLLLNSNMTIQNNNAGNGCASISTADGQILFYSDGSQIYNKLGNQMPNGNFPLGGVTNQPALFVPHPGNPNLYYFFMTRGEFSLCNCSGDALKRFTYSVIDKTLNNNQGGIVTNQKDLPLHNFAGSSMTIAKTNSEDGYWLLNSYHSYFNGNTELFAIKIDDLGMHPAVVSSIPNFDVTSIYGNGMKVSPDNQKVAIFSKMTSSMKVFLFNSATGILGNEIISCTNCTLTSIEFSSDSNQLFTTSNVGASVVYNLQGTLPAHRAYADAGYLGLQRAIDGNIYLTRKGIFQGQDSNIKLYKILNQNSFLNSSIDNTSISFPNIVGNNLPQFIPLLQRPCESINLVSEPNLAIFTYNNKSDITTQGNYLINQSIQNITMQARDFILLKSNTQIKNGSTFLAKIQQCSEGLLKETYSEKKMNLKDQSENTIKLYPNPNNGNFTIFLNKEMENASIEIFDIYGKTIFKGKSETATFDLNLPGLNSGMYLVKISNNNSSETLKFIKK